MKPTWLRQLFSGSPHFVIGGSDRPYLLRWYLIPRNRLFNVYLHKFLRDDDDRALHDHPWWFVSVILRSGYFEVTPAGTVPRRLLSVALRPAEHRHRVVLRRDQLGAAVPCWTLLVTGPKVRTWGFWCPRGFIPWQRFTASGDSGAVGRGCDG